MLFSTIFFLSYYYFFEFDDSFFFFQDTYNTRLKERYGDDPSTHSDLDSDLWLEAKSSGGPDKNRVYSLSNTITKDLRTTRGVSILYARNRFQALKIQSSG
jgi:hypothetical protein